MNYKVKNPVELHARVALRKNTMEALKWARDKKGYSISGLVERAVAEFFEKEGWAEKVGPWDAPEPEDQAKIDKIMGGPQDENGNIITQGEVENG